MRRLPWLCLWLACILSSVSAGSDADLSRRVDKLVERKLGPKRPGAAVLVVRHGKVVHSKGYGIADLKAKTPVTPQTVFDLASVSKQFTALAVLILYERGQLRLDDDVRKYLPELLPRKQGREVRVNDLLRHTAGLPEYFDFVDVAKATNEDVLRAVAKRKPVRAAGIKHEYCNTDYVLAALVVERVANKKLPTFLRQEVFRPLRMNRTTICAGPAGTPDRARGYAKGDDGKLHLEHGETPIYGDGSVFTTLEDMARWDAGLRTHKVVKAETLRLAWSLGRLDNGKRFNYGLGWVIERDNKKLVVWHNGSWGGFRTYILRHVDDELTVVVLTNSDSQEPEDIGGKIAELYLGGGK